MRLKQRGSSLGPLMSLVKCCKSQSRIPHITAGGRTINSFRSGFHMKAQRVAEQLIKIA